MELIVKDSGERIDKYLITYTNFSRSKIQNLIKTGKILVNNQCVSSNYKVKENDFILVDDSFNYNTELEKENIDLDILYEDDYLLIINKKSGMVVHPGNGNYNHTLVNALLYRYGDFSKDKVRPGIVHRIDKDTSGVMVVAKDDNTLNLLSDMIKNKLVKRVYYAIVDGIIPNNSGTIDAPIGRDNKNREKMTVTDINSKNAITHFKVLKRFKNSNKTLIECILDTGRTHQIRVHMAYIGYPIFNDPVYGNKNKTTEFHQYLHSKSISFIHPITKKEINIESELPEEFKILLEKIDN